MINSHRFCEDIDNGVHDDIKITLVTLAKWLSEYDDKKFSIFFD